MIHTVDAVVIGGGPAGAACATSLQQRGISNLILDKSAFPRHKTCGGLLTQKSVLLLESLLPELSDETLAAVFCDESRVLELYDGRTRLTRSEIAYPLRSVRRFDFDHFLIGQYRKLGGAVLEKQTGYRLDTEKRRILLQNGDEIHYKYCVAADGALSKTRAALGCKDPTLGFCVETWVDKALLATVDAVGIAFGVVPAGYAWVFPSGKELCIGLGGVYDRENDYPGILRGYLGLLGLDPTAFPIRGAFVPIGKPVDQRKAPKNSLLIGDAGGFVDPMYGEGLYYALATGIYAAEAITEAEAAAADGSTGDAKKVFWRKTATLRKQLKAGVRVQRFFFRDRTIRAFCDRIQGKNRFVAYYSDVQLSTNQIPYTDLFRLYFSYRKR